MKFIHFPLIVISFLPIFAHASDRVALLIANQDYTRDDLKNPVNDAKLIQQKLKKLNYDVNILTDASESQMIQAISDFGHDAKGADSAIFYYSGHGMQDKHRQNYLIPVDANISSDVSIRAEGVDVEEVVSAMNDARPRVSLVVLDACRDNPYARVRGSRNFQVESYEMPDSRFLVSYATQSGQVAQDGDGKNSPFAIALGEQLDIAHKTPIMLMFSNVRDRVNDLTNNEQSPMAKGDLGYYTTLVPKQQISQEPVRVVQSTVTNPPTFSNNNDKKKDLDRDGVLDYLDRCPGTPNHILVDKYGCRLKSSDSVPVSTSYSETSSPALLIKKTYTPISP